MKSYQTTGAVRLQAALDAVSAIQAALLARDLGEAVAADSRLFDALGDSYDNLESIDAAAAVSCAIADYQGREGYEGGKLDMALVYGLDATDPASWGEALDELASDLADALGAAK